MGSCCSLDASKNELVDDNMAVADGPYGRVTYGDREVKAALDI